MLPSPVEQGPPPLDVVLHQQVGKQGQGLAPDQLVGVQHLRGGWWVGVGGRARAWRGTSSWGSGWAGGWVGGAGPACGGPVQEMKDRKSRGIQKQGVLFLLLSENNKIWNTNHVWG